MSTSTQWQLAREAAERYESILVPAILGPFAEALVEWSKPYAGETILDVGCGTGAAARHALKIVGASGRVKGLDLNTGMLEVARSISSARGDSIEWQEGNASQLLFDDETFDLILCAQTLQFLSDRQKALTEMRRVLKSDGRVAISLWCDMEANPYFHALVDSVTNHIGADTAAGLRAIFGLSHARQIHVLLADAGFEKVSMTEKQLDLEFPELHEFVPRHISATPMAAGFKSAPHEQQQTVITEVADRLASFKTGRGPRIPFKSHFVMAEK